MAKKSVLEKQVCAACGADVRPQALFCYNCGAAVAPDAENKNGVSSAWFQSDLTEGAKTNNLSQNDLPIQKPLDEPIVKPDGEPKPSAENKPDEPAKQLEKLKTAASMRQKTRVKSFQKKKVEVVWEPPEESPNIWFIAAAGIFALLALGVLLAMLSIK
jgi:ribosomal protein L40E